MYSIWEFRPVSVHLHRWTGLDRTGPHSNLSIHLAAESKCIQPCMEYWLWSRGNCCRDKQAIINACIRHAMQQLGLDLSNCKSWTKFMEVQYQRPPVSKEIGARETDEVFTKAASRLASRNMIATLIWSILFLRFMYWSMLYSMYTRLPHYSQ